MHTSCRASSELPAFPGRVAIPSTWGQVACAGANPPLLMHAIRLFTWAGTVSLQSGTFLHRGGQVSADAIPSRWDRLSSMVLPGDSAQVYLRKLFSAKSTLLPLPCSDLSSSELCSECQSCANFRVHTKCVCGDPVKCSWDLAGESSRILYF